MSDAQNQTFVQSGMDRTDFVDCIYVTIHYIGYCLSLCTDTLFTVSVTMYGYGITRPHITSRASGKSQRIDSFSNTLYILPESKVTGQCRSR